MKNLDNEFYLELERCVVSDIIKLPNNNGTMLQKRLIHVIDKESYDYSQYHDNERQNIFDEFFNNNVSEFIKYLPKKRYGF